MHHVFAGNSFAEGDDDRMRPDRSVVSDVYPQYEYQPAFEIACYTLADVSGDSVSELILGSK